MSLIVVFKGREGIVMGADSRITLTGNPPVYYDNATKLIQIKGLDHLGVMTCGSAFVDAYFKRTPHSFLPDIEAGTVAESDDSPTVEKSANQLGSFFEGMYNAAFAKPSSPIQFVVGGFDHDNPYGKLFTLSIPDAVQPTPVYFGASPFGLYWDGMPQFAQRIILGYDSFVLAGAAQILNLTPDQMNLLSQQLGGYSQANIPYEILSLQDGVDLVILLIRTTIAIMNLTTGFRSVGGPIEIATITRSEGFKFVQRKTITGEGGVHAV